MYAVLRMSMGTCQIVIAEPLRPKAIPCVTQYEQRSAIMREWAAARPSRALFLDFDALSLAPNAPPTTRSWDKHYMCAPHHGMDWWLDLQLFPRWAC